MSFLNILFLDIKTRTKRIFRNKNAIIWLLIIPILITGIVQSSLPKDTELTTIYIQDRDGHSSYADVLRMVLEEEYNVVEVSKYVDYSKFIEEEKRKQSSRIMIFIVIPDHFDDYVRAYSLTGSFESQVRSGDLSFIAQLSKTSTEDYDDGNIHAEFFYPNVKTVSDSDIMSIDDGLNRFYLPGLMCSLILFVTSGLTVGALRFERDSRIDVLLKQVRYNKLLKVLSLMIWGLIPSAIIMVVVYSISYIFIPILPYWYIVIAFFITSIFSTTLGLLVSELVYGNQSMVIANSSIVSCLIFLSGGIIPINFLPKIIASLTQLNPLRYIMGLMHTSISGKGLFLIDVVVPLVAIIAIVLIWYGINYTKDKQ